MKDIFSDRLKDIIALAFEQAISLNHPIMSTEHLFFAMIKDDLSTAYRVLKNFDLNQIEDKLMQIYPKGEKPVSGNLLMNDKGKFILNGTVKEAELLNSNNGIITVHLLLSILSNDSDFATILKDLGISYEKVKIKCKNILLKEEDLPYMKLGYEHNDDDYFEEKNEVGEIGNLNKKSKTPMLDSFGRDLTAYAMEEKLDPLVGRQEEVERVSQILSRRKKNNPLLIGEPGVGKSAIAEGLAMRIANKKVSRVLFNKRVVMLDLASLVAGTKYRGQFEERMKTLMTELEHNKDVILFIDEIHIMVGSGSTGGALDASNIFKPALARGELQCIGATTLDECRQHIEKDGALVRRFQKVMIEPTTVDETITILKNIKNKYEDYHNVTYSDDAIASCVKLTDKYITDRFFPDKAIDVLDESGSRVHITNIKVPKEVLELEEILDKIKQEKVKVIKSQKYEEAAHLRDLEKVKQEELKEVQYKWQQNVKKNKKKVSEQNIAEVVAMITGIPVNKIAEKESKLLQIMPNELNSKVIGQSEAVQKIVRAIQRNRVGLKDPKKPIGSFIFFGPTGVGKTQLAKELSNMMFDSKDSLIRIDMSEYMEKFAVSRLIGSPPGYVGYEEGGQLTERVRIKPYSVVLLDEIEKAHPDVFNLLLQVLDDGYITDSMGRRINFSNTIIIMTSNIGIRQLNDFGTGVGFGTSAKYQTQDYDTKNIIQLALKKYFAPEFLNRLDDIILFNALKQEDILKIIDIELNKLSKRIEEIGCKISVTKKVKKYIAKEGYDPLYGARPLNRAIQKYIEDKLAEEFLKSNIVNGDKIKIDLKKDEIQIGFLTRVNKN